MNQILVATIIAVSIIGAGAYAASQVSEVSTASSMSSDIDIEKKSENMNVFFNGSINIINTGKDQSEIAMFRFYDSSGIKVHQVMIPDENGRTFGADPQVSNSLLTSNDATLPRHTTQSFSLVDLGIVSLVDLGIVSLEDITGELVTKRGRTFPISFDEWTNQNGDGTGDGIIEAVEKFLKKLKTNQNGDGTGADTSAGTIEAVEEFLDEWTNQNGVGTGDGTIEAIEEFLDELKTNQNGDGTGAGTGAGTIEAIEEFLEKLKTNPNGDGKTLTDGLGVYLAIQHINTNGKVYFGSGNNPGSQTDIRQYVGVGNNDDWAIAITDDERVASTPMRVPEFGKEYVYSSGSLFDVTNTPPNILWYSSSKIISGTPSISDGYDGITVSGTGTVLMKLNPYINTMMIRGTLNNADVKIVTSPLDLIPVSMSGSKFVLYNNPSASWSVSTTSREVGCGSHRCGGGWPTGYEFRHTYTTRSTPNIIIADNSPLTTSQSATITSSTVPTGLLISQLQNYQVIKIRHTTSVPTPAISHQLYSIAPWNVQNSYTADFEQIMILPTDAYIVVTVNGIDAVIKGETFDPSSQPFFEVVGLPEDIAYDVSKSGITGVVGKTSNIGKISLLAEDVDFGISASPGGILKIYPDSAKYLGSIDNVAMIDLYNGYSIPLSTSTNLVYIPQDFVRLVFPVAVETKNVSVDNTPLDDLNKNYTKNEALMIPVIPGAETIYATINGEDVEVLMRYVSAPTQIKQVPQKSSISSDHSTSEVEVASTSSNISTSTFLTATHDGMMGVNLDLKVGGSADYTMDSSYAGAFTKSTNCKWHGASSPYRTYSCSTNTHPSSPDSILNIDSLTSAHRAQLVESLNNGQASNLTVEVDIFRNMQYVNTKLIYTSDSAQASITSTLDEAGYGASNQVHITYPLTSVSDNIAIPVTAGDMMEFVVRVNLQALGTPTPSSSNGAYSSYVQVKTEFGGGVITTGMF